MFTQHVLALACSDCPFMHRERERERERERASERASERARERAGGREGGWRETERADGEERPETRAGESAATGRRGPEKKQKHHPAEFVAAWPVVPPWCRPPGKVHLHACEP